MFIARKQIGCEDFTGKGGGEGITIAVLDTGISTHPDFRGRILAFRDFVNGMPYVYDDSGHGTHVCGIAAGNGQLSRGRYRGVAPRASLVVGKVLNEQGDGSVDAMLKADTHCEYFGGTRRQDAGKKRNASSGKNGGSVGRRTSGGLCGGKQRTGAGQYFLYGRKSEAHYRGML